MKNKIIFLLLTVIPFLGGCNNTEDLKGLIVGKTWRLDCFYYKSGDAILDRYPTANKILENNPNGFYLKFNENNTFTGQAINSSFSGTWTGNSRSNDFSMTITQIAGSDDSQAIASDFVKAVSGAYSYKADENILTIHYSYSGRNEYMSFRIK